MPDPGQGGVASVKAEDGGAVKADQATETAAYESVLASGSHPESEPESESEPEAESGSVPEAASETGAEDESGSGSDPDAVSGRRLPVATGIGCAALLLPLVAVAGAILCFAAGILSAASGCAPNGSALCSANGPWLAFALPLFVSPLIAAGTAIGAVTVRRHRSTWLAVGYGVVFISVIVGLASASTGSG
jgi:hypothetical protein